MTVTKGTLGSPLPVGKTFPVLKNVTTGAGEDTRKFGVDADGVFFWVNVQAVTGTVTIQIDTIGEDDTDYKPVHTFVISSPTAEPEEYAAVNILSTIRVTVTYTGSCEYSIRARGISRGGAGADDAPLTVTTDFTPVLVVNPTIQNLILTTAGAEQAVVLPLVKRFKFQATNDALLQYAYVANSSEVVTVWPGNCEEEYDINSVNLTIYIKSNKDNTPLQLVMWT